MTSFDWNLVFDKWGIKSVRPNDKKKSAYVLSAAQLEAVKDAGITPSSNRPADPFDMETPFDPDKQTVVSSFYHSIRSAEAGRDPEPRMGRELISSWLEEDEEVLIGNIGQKLYAIKIDSVSHMTTEQVMQRFADICPPPIVVALAKKAKTKPVRKPVLREEFARNPIIVAAAIHRAKEQCEMPGCNATLFRRGDGSAYLEVHHILPLSEEGFDSLDNVAALCPSCHREQHHGRDRAALRDRLQKHICSLP